VLGFRNPGDNELFTQRCGYGEVFALFSFSGQSAKTSNRHQGDFPQVSLNPKA